MSTRKRVVVIGAGLVGCAIADEITARDAADVTVVDNGPEPGPDSTGHSTGHSPGLAFQLSPSRAISALTRRTLAAYAELRYDGRACFTATGSLTVATTPDRMHELRRRHDLATSWGIASQLCDPDECAALHPLLTASPGDPAGVLGGLYVPSDGFVDETAAAGAHRRRATERGATFRWRHEVTGVPTRDGTVTGVRTNHGVIDADLVICAAGTGTPAICQMAQVEVPVVPLPTTLLDATSPVEATTGAVPALWHDNASLALWFPSAGGVRLSAATPDNAETAAASLWARAVDVLPALQGGQPQGSRNVPSPRTAGDYPLLGEAPELAGFWLATSVWAAHAAGVAEALVEWIFDGSPRTSLHECALGRFIDVQHDPEYTRTRSSRTFVWPHGVITPLPDGPGSPPLRPSPFHVRQRELGAVTFELGGRVQPSWHEANSDLAASPAAQEVAQFAGMKSAIPAAEALAARNQVALFDLTPMQRLRLTGPGALAYLQRLTTNNLDKPPGTMRYTLLLTEHGSIRGDMTVARLGDEEFFLGPSWNIPVSWFRAVLPGDGSVRLTDLTLDTCCLGLWGPQARALIGEVTDDDFSREAMGFFRVRRAEVAGRPVTALQLSQIGELGWELSMRAEHGLAVWDALWAAGRQYGAITAGRAALTSLRLEKGYRSLGMEMTGEHHPDEAGLTFLVRPDKGDFIGREQYLARRDRELERSLHCLVMADPRHAVSAGAPVFDRPDGRRLGYVTSAAFGYTTRQRIAYAWLDGPARDAGTDVVVRYDGQSVPATVHDDPLYDPAGARLRS